MKVEVLLVANSAKTEKGLLYVEGGGWEHYSAPFFPFTVRGALCGILTFEPSEIGSTPIVILDINDQLGQVEGSRASITVITDRPPATPGVPTRIPFWLPFSSVVTGPTVVSATLSQDGQVLGSVAFAVKDPVPDTPPSA